MDLLEGGCFYFKCNNLKVGVISELQMAFQNQEMFLYLLSIMLILTIKWQIHFCITPLVYLPIQEN